MILVRLAALALMLGAPAWAWSVWLARTDPTADRIDRLAAALAAPWISVVALWLVWRVTPSTLGTVVALALATAVPLVATSPRAHRASRNTVRPSVAVALLVMAVGFALLVAIPFLPFGLERADGVHRMAMTDWYKHLAVTTSLTVGERFPPDNPFLAGDGPAPYYYGFHLLAAAAARTLGGSSHVYPVLVVLTLVTAASVPVVAFVLARGVVGTGRRPLAAAFGATFLAGFDLAVMAVDGLSRLPGADRAAGAFGWLRAVTPSTHLDYWIHHDERQFNPPYVTAIWAPQHLAAALLAVLALHWLRRDRPTCARQALGPGLALAAVPLLSAYVGIAVAAGLVVAVLVEALRDVVRRERSLGAVAARLVRRWGWAAALPLACAVATLGDVVSTRAGRLGVGVSSAGTWRNGALATTLLGDGTLARLLDTPIVYLVELGLIGLLAAVALVGRDRSRATGDADPGTEPHRRRLALMAVAILVLVAVVRPPVGWPNNLYARPLLVVWLLLAPIAMTAISRLGRRAVAVLAAIGLAGTAYAVTGAFLEGALFWAAPPADVEVAEWLSVHAPAPARIAADPDSPPAQLLYRVRRRPVIGDPRHARLFGALDEEVARALDRLRDAYAAPASEAGPRFASLGADFVVRRRGADPLSASRCLERVHANRAWEVLAVDRRACGLDR